MPGRGRKHLQFVGYEFADTYPGVGSICNLLELDLQIHIGVNSGRGSICNLLELDLQMHILGWKHLQLAEIGAADAYYQVDIKNPTTIDVGLFFYVEKEQNVLVDK